MASFDEVFVVDDFPGNPEKAKLMFPRLPDEAKSSFISLLLIYLLIDCCGMMCWDAADDCPEDAEDTPVASEA